MPMQIQEPLLEKIATLKNLPSLPHILLKLIEACNDHNGDFRKLSGIIEKDPSLSVKILKLVNSAYYGLPHRVESIRQAASILGINAIRNIAICTSVHEVFNHDKGSAGFNLKLFWWHSLKCAVLSRLIAKKTTYGNADEAFLSGLLHDIGRLVLSLNFPEPYSALSEASKDKQHLLLDGETRLVATHCEIGSFLLRQWKFQPFMADAVLYHHESKSEIFNALPLVQIVYVANALCQGPVQGVDEGLKAAEDVFGFKEIEVEAFLSQADEETQQVAKSLNIEIEQPGNLTGPSPENDLEKHKDLADEVKHISLLFGTLQDLLEADGQDAILKTVHQGLQILFDAENVIFFIRDPEKDCLMGKTGTENKGHSAIKGLLIPMQMKKSLLITSLKQGKPLDSFRYSTDQGPVILDRQIIRFLGKEGIICLPMFSGEERVGIIVIGLDQAEFSRLSKQFKFLNLFSNQAAVALHVDYLKQTRFSTIQSERLKASSALSQKVVHEVKTPISIIKNYITIMRQKLVADNRVQEELEFINEEIDRVDHIINELSDFSESKTLTIGPLDINALLSYITKVLKKSHLLGSDINLHLALDPSLPPIDTDANKVKQIFINLIRNAVEAMRQGGNLSISTQYVSNKLDTPLQQNTNGNLNYAQITIKDDGPGIPDALKYRVFEPYVTTKRGGHAGLGLSIVFNIVKELKGTITCESDGQNGTCFGIVFPMVQEQTS